MQPYRDVACLNVIGFIRQLSHRRREYRLAAVEIEWRGEAKRVGGSLVSLEKCDSRKRRCNGEAHSVDLAGAQHDEASRVLTGYGLFRAARGCIRQLGREDNAYLGGLAG
jgi:hypothetical protein